MNALLRTAACVCAAALCLAACGEADKKPTRIKRSGTPPAASQPVAPAVPVVRDGLDTEWFDGPAHKKRAEGMRKDGKREGAWTWYDESTGKRVVAGQFVDDLAQGSWTEYFPDGAKKKEDQWEKGKLHGLSTEYAQGGAKLGETHYQNGALDGKSTHWYANGQLSSEAEFEHGVPTGELRAFYEDGKPKILGRLEAGKRSGPWRFWKADGTPDLAVSGIYSEGKRSADLPGSFLSTGDSADPAHAPK